MANDVAIKQRYTYGELERMATAVAKSGLFGVKTPESALTLMLIAQEDGTSVAAACRDYHIIEGKPALKVDAMLARFQAAGGRVKLHELTDQKAEATFDHPNGGSVKLAWTMDMATKAGLASKDVWKKYPRAMLRSRLMSEGIRTVSPGSVVGIYTPEELLDEPELRDITPRGERPPEPVKARDDVIDVDVDTSTGEIKTAVETEAPRMDPSAVEDHLSAIESTATIADLKVAHRKAYEAAHAAGDGKALLRFENAKIAHKNRLQS